MRKRLISKDGSVVLPIAIGMVRMPVHNEFGSVVQLVRMPPCHGGGRGFESRPVRFNFGLKPALVVGFAFCGLSVVLLINRPNCTHL
jgi:hypothetical protein